MRKSDSDILYEARKQFNVKDGVIIDGKVYGITTDLSVKLDSYQFANMLRRMIRINGFSRFIEELDGYDDLFHEDKVKMLMDFCIKKNLLINGEPVSNIKYAPKKDKSTYVIIPSLKTHYFAYTKEDAEYIMSILTKEYSNKLSKLESDKQLFYIKDLIESEICNNNKISLGADRLAMNAKSFKKVLSALNVISEGEYVDRVARIMKKYNNSKRKNKSELKALHESILSEFHSIDIPITFSIDSSNESSFIYCPITEFEFLSNKVCNLKDNYIINTDVTMIDKDAFRGKGLKKVKICDSITTISEGAFADNDISFVRLPKRLVTIGKEAFKNNKLTKVLIPRSVCSIWEEAFRNNKLKKVEFEPNSELTLVGQNIFDNNPGLKYQLPPSVKNSNGKSCDRWDAKISQRRQKK